ncbi:hypothetical protein LCGC14_1446980 [marine sediment metagenome]|uniref:Uncharacterized protein n=1 Tax=marine sediment metagenome TaxID=412755 RepID=A0A0F9MKW1_9ZZZZ
MDQFYLREARLGNVYHSHNTTAGAVTVLSTTCTGLVLANPFNSGKELIVANMSFVGSTLTTIREIGIAVPTEVQETIVTAGATTANIYNGKLAGAGVNQGVGVTYSIATLTSTPLWFRPLGSARVTNAVEGLGVMSADFDGTVIVPPGFYIAFSTLTAAATGLCSITWVETDPS